MRPHVVDRRVLVTGASGLIGAILMERLRPSHPLSGLDVHPSQWTEHIVDMRSLSDVVAAFQGVDTVVDLAAMSNMDSSWDEVYANNLPATINAFEAARICGVRRVVYASSNHVVGLAERDEPYASVTAGSYAGLDPQSLPRVRSEDPIRPDGPYGIGKALGEAAGRHYAEEHGISVLCLRIGTVNPPDRPTNPRHFATLLSHRDLVTLVRCCLDAPESLRYGVYFGVSANRWRIWDIEDARRELGYEPLDDAEQWR